MPSFNSGRNYSIRVGCRHKTVANTELKDPEKMSIKELKAELNRLHIEYTLPIEKEELIEKLNKYRRECRGSLHKGGRSRRRRRSGRGRRTRRCY